MQLARPGADQKARRALALPYVMYRGRLLHADGSGAGLRAVHTEGFELDVSFAGSLSSGSESLRAREGVARLGTLLEAGPVARWFPNGRSARDRITFELPLRGMNLTPDLRLYAFGRLDGVAGAANRASPLVRQKTGASYGIGLAYTPTRSMARASD